MKNAPASSPVLLGGDLPETELEGSTPLTIRSSIRGIVQAQTMQLIVDHLCEKYPGYMRNDYMLFAISVFAPQYAEWFEMFSSLHGVTEEFFRFSFAGNPSRVLSQVCAPKSPKDFLQDIEKLFSENLPEPVDTTQSYVSDNSGEIRIPQVISTNPALSEVPAEVAIETEPVHNALQTVRSAVDVFGPGFIDEKTIEQAMAEAGVVVVPPVDRPDNGVESKRSLTYDVLRQVHQALKPQK